MADTILTPITAEHHPATDYPYLAWVDPFDILCENPARDVEDIADTRPELVDSVRRWGVDSVIKTSPTEQGTLRARWGFSRVAAARLAVDLYPKVLTLVVAPEAPDIELIHKGIENIVRTGYTPVEEAALFTRIAAMGTKTAEEIAPLADTPRRATDHLSGSTERPQPPHTATTTRRTVTRGRSAALPQRCAEHGRVRRELSGTTPGRCVTAATSGVGTGRPTRPRTPHQRVVGPTAQTPHAPPEPTRCPRSRPRPFLLPHQEEATAMSYSDVAGDLVIVLLILLVFRLFPDD